MPEIPSLLDLLKAGVHFGHKEQKWHPKMKPYLFTVRNGIHVIDLEKTVEHLKRALEFIKDTVAKGGTALLIGTKPQARKFVRAAAEQSNSPYVVERWLGGTLTNFSVIQKLVKKLESIERKLGDPEVDAKYTKLERLMFDRERQRLEEAVGGIRNLKGLPQIIILADVLHDETAVKEARRRKVPTIALCDSNVDPEVVTFPIAANDDASRSIELIMQLCAGAINEGVVARAAAADVLMKEAQAVVEEEAGEVAISEDIVKEAAKKAGLKVEIEV